GCLLRDCSRPSCALWPATILLSATSSAATALEKGALGLRRRQRRRAPVGCRCLSSTTESPQQIRARRVKQVVLLQVQLVNQRERHRGTVDFADRHRAIECYDWRRRDGEQLVVQGHNLRPICHVG